MVCGVLIISRIQPLYSNKPILTLKRIIVFRAPMQNMTVQTNTFDWFHENILKNAKLKLFDLK